MAVENYIFNFCIALKLIFILDRVCGLMITELDVPALVDPRDSLELGCAYDMGGEDLYSVKWYKDEQEFFRYTPRQQPHVMAFPVAGVHLAPEPHCDAAACRVRLARLSTAHSGGAYKCEVSTEAPQFRVGLRAANVTVAALGRAAPEVRGLRAEYAAADLVQAECVAARADPPPRLAWLLNGRPAPAGAAGPQRASPPDLHGLVAAATDLRFHAERRHFPLQLVCVAHPPPGVPAEPQASQPATARLHDPQHPAPQQRNVLGNQKLEWLNGKASVPSIHQGLLFTVLVTFCWR